MKKEKPPTVKQVKKILDDMNEEDSKELDERLLKLAELREFDEKSNAFETILKLAEAQAFSPHFVALCVSEYLEKEG